jgi:hypothetical protein
MMQALFHDAVKKRVRIIASVTFASQFGLGRCIEIRKNDIKKFGCTASSYKKCCIGKLKPQI